MIEYIEDYDRTGDLYGFVDFKSEEEMIGL